LKAFGKAYGACSDGPGEKPEINPIYPYNGKCSLNSGPIGKGKNTFTSGLEGQWYKTLKL
jgi:catalase (peroxidase I)